MKDAVCESGMGFTSRNYKNYKPYKAPERGYNWKDYMVLSEDGQRVISCHSCDIRRTGCLSSVHPRYYCKKDKVERQTTLGDF